VASLAAGPPGVTISLKQDQTRGVGQVLSSIGVYVRASDQSTVSQRGRGVHIAHAGVVRAAWTGADVT
jgi:hypothetical protein